jgi:type II secretory pathway component GspD/PulD (secretin)
VYDLNNIGFEGADKSELEEAIQQVLTPDAYYKINTQSGKLIVEDIPEVQEKIEKILKAFDQPPKQVMIQCEIIATQFSEGFNYSIDWTVSGDLFSSVIDGLTGRGVSAGTGTGATPTVTAGSVPVGSQFGTNTTAQNQNTLGFLDFRNEFPIVSAGGSGLNAQYLSKNAYIALKTAMSDTRTRILQQPRVLAMNQKEVSFIVGQQVPFFSGGNSTYNNNNNPNNYYSSSGPVQQRIDVGLQLIIRPVILNNGLVQMEVEFSNSDADKTQELFAGQLYSAIGTRNEELVSTLIIPSGETRVIGGLVQDTRSNTRGGVPGLVKIPVIGPALFGKYDAPEDSNRRRNILIFITPVIVEEQVAALRKYKGNLLVGEEQPEEFTTPSATLSDTYMEPLPVDMPGMHAVDEAVKPPASRERPMVIEPFDSRPARSSEPPPIQQFLDEAPVEEQPIVDEGLKDLRRIRIADVSTTGPNVIVPRGPSGALTGPGAGTGAVAGAATAAARPAAPPAGAAAPPPAATPGVFRPAGAAAPAAPPTPAPAPPPRTETKY